MLLSFCLFFWKFQPGGGYKLIKVLLIKKRINQLEVGNDCPRYTDITDDDGHHKLIRWRFIIHRGINGYSRKIVYLWCSANNKLEKVMSLLDSAVEKHGLPLRLHGDQEVENVAVARYMFANPQWGPDIRSFKASKSCHNQRIERLCRDVLLCVLVLSRCWINGYCGWVAALVGSRFFARNKRRFAPISEQLK